MIDVLKKQIANYKLKKIKEIPRRKVLSNLNMVSLVGITGSVEDEEIVFEAETKLAKLGISTSTLLYNPLTKEPIKDDKRILLHNKNTNWYYKPEQEIIKNWVNKEFDYTLNLNNGNAVPLNFVISLSKSRCKVTFIENIVSTDYDLVISQNVKKNYVDSFIKTIKELNK